MSILLNIHNKINIAINERIEKERAIIKEKDEQLTQKEVQLTEKDAIIEELRKQLAAYQNQ